MDKILILLSTYNGEKYLEQQLESIYIQKDVDITLFVRDDGSTDNTINILKKWQTKLRLYWYSGSNIKPAKSFMDLVHKSKKFDYYAYCDQDDIWDDQKLKVAISKLKQVNNKIPALYCCSLELVNYNLDHLKMNKINRVYSFEESLLRNNLIGCGMVFNKALCNILKMYMPKYIEMHDSWTLRICLAFDGKVLIDPMCYIKYRQHNNNVIGAKIKKIDKLKSRIKELILDDKQVTYYTSIEIINGYENKLKKEKKDILNSIINYKNSLKNKIYLIYIYKNINKKLKHKLSFIIEVLLEKI